LWTFGSLIICAKITLKYKCSSKNAHERQNMMRILKQLTNCKLVLLAGNKKGPEGSAEVLSMAPFAQILKKSI
jgi:hypothetical protein